MNILVLDEEFPYPLNTGKRIRSFNLMRRLAERHTVHYLAYGHDGSDSWRAMQRAGMTPIAVPHRLPAKSGPFFYLRLLANLFSTYPYSVSSHYTRPFADALHARLEQHPADLIIAEWSPYAIYVKDVQSARKLIVAHNIEARIWSRYYENEAQPIKRWYIGRQTAKMGKFEHEAFHWVDGATAVSADEAGAITAYNRQLPVEVIENGVDLNYFTPADNTHDSNQLVFTGAMDWRPNQDAADYFTNEIFPLLRKKCPEVRMTFVGRNPPRQMQRLNQVKGITVTGTVPDVRPYIAKATAYVVPLRIGGGSRLKVLEALAMKKAVITTPVGAEGLELVDGREVLVADTPREFVRQIERVLADPELGCRLGENGRRLVEQRYSWDHLADKLDRFLKELVASA